MFTLIRYVPLIVGIALLSGASLSCTFWFFYSFLYDPAAIESASFHVSEHKIQMLPAIAGSVGCGAQMFAYAFTANLSYVKSVAFKSLLILVAALTVCLAAFSAYSTLVSFFNSKAQLAAENAYADMQQKEIFANRARDMETISASASKAVSENYRSQGKTIALENESLRTRQTEELTKYQASLKAGKATSPMDSLLGLTGEKAVYVKLLCAWIAITFDLLPLIGISLLSQMHRCQFKSFRNADDNKEEWPNSKIDSDEKVLPKIERSRPLNQGIVRGSDHQHTPAEAKTSCFEANNTSEVIQRIIEKPAIYSDLPESMQQTGIADIPSEITYPIITRYLARNEIPLSYQGVMNFTGLSKWRVQQYFTRAVENGFLVNNTAANIKAGYTFTKSERYRIRVEVDISTVEANCATW